MSRDTQKTPRQSNTWTLWRAGSEELLEMLLSHAAALHKRGNHERGRSASGLADGVVNFIERLDTTDMKDDAARVLRATQFAELNKMALDFMAGTDPPPAACVNCIRRRV